MHRIKREMAVVDAGIARQSALAQLNIGSRAILIRNTSAHHSPNDQIWMCEWHTRRFTRLTNAFSKKVENHAHSVALFAMYYNFVRIHKTLRTTPAMAANVTKRLWEIGDIVDVLEAWE